VRVVLKQDESFATIGIIFPFFPKHLERLLNQHKTVFVKFFGRERIPVNLHPGSKLFLYESKGDKEIMGEAKILRVESLRASDVISVYGERLFLTQSEFDEYVGNRRDKRILVLVLEDAKRYAVPLKLNRSVTMAGRYMTSKMYKDLRDESKTIAD
jgi:hypothetical protein